MQFGCMGMWFLGDRGGAWCVITHVSLLPGQSLVYMFNLIKFAASEAEENSKNEFDAFSLSYTYKLPFFFFLSASNVDKMSVLCTSSIKHFSLLIWFRCQPIMCSPRGLSHPPKEGICSGLASEWSFTLNHLIIIYFSAIQ